jgi:hypothetical protein
MFSGDSPINFTDLKFLAENSLELRVIDACVFFGRHQSHWAKDIRQSGREPVDAPLAILMRIVAKYPFVTNFTFVRKHFDISDLTGLLKKMATGGHEAITDFNLSLYMGSEGTAVRGYAQGTMPSMPRQRIIDLAVVILTPEYNKAASVFWGETIEPSDFLKAWEEAAEQEAHARGFGSMAGVGAGKSWTKTGLKRALKDAAEVEPSVRRRRAKRSLMGEGGLKPAFAKKQKPKVVAKSAEKKPKAKKPKD